ncbi:MAG: hypothetical protein GY928_15740 [Colwellia sp.]|nr:hypothetical protein [Colwellia sp.]
MYIENDESVGLACIHRDETKIHNWNKDGLAAAGGSVCVNRSHVCLSTSKVFVGFFNIYHSLFFPVRSRQNESLRVLLSHVVVNMSHNEH